MELRTGHDLDVAPDVTRRGERGNVDDPPLAPIHVLIEVGAAVALAQRIDRTAGRILTQEPGLDDLNVLPTVPVVVKGIQAGDPVKGIVAVDPDLRAILFLHHQTVSDHERST